MIAVLYTLFIGIFEVWGLLYFLNTYMECRFKGVKKIISYLAFYIVFMVVVIVFSNILTGYAVIAKIFFIIIGIALYGRISYSRGFITCLFFACVDYILLFYVDCVYVSIMGMDEGLVTYVMGIVLRLIWIALLVFLRHKTGLIKKYLYEERISLRKYSWLPVFSGFIGIYLYVMFISNNVPNYFYAFVSLAILCLNALALFFLQDSIVQEEKIYQSERQNQKHKNQMQTFYDRQALYERQGRKLHDYKKQMMTVNELIRKGELEAALEQTEAITKNMSVELSEINVNHPVVNAILNQEYRIAKGKGIGMTFSICDLSGLTIAGEDIVTIFGNLLENAIQACEVLVEKGNHPTVHIKMVNADSKYIFNIKNPVPEKVEIEDNNIVSKDCKEHGIGLLNVRSTVEKYNGDFVISCNEKEFVAVVMLKQ